ncbi:DMT family transporter [Magnetospirillum fulvum]|uniref:Permease of the drug/metabolite transporter (DMT) superfamily n=1 Tax=Magnetospirillum fulvum TaxID=1082 RepID=A0A1H6HDD3_MAGFU|nr:DMT family transporter [Magnetospirillum fulvum]SEH32205.1 Permease of the drug/metabolite transporter (DMT) superfamily [Magnetospirillum fulvum]
MTHKGVAAALAAAMLFGISTPLAKALLGTLDPWLLAGSLYLGSGLGLAALRLLTPGSGVRLARSDLPWLAGAIVSGGIVAPVLLMIGLAGSSAGTASLLLNAEAVFTALLAWIVFRENADRRIVAGMGAIVAGAVALSWPGPQAPLEASGPALAILAACLCWGIDNNLTRKVSLADPLTIAAIKGLAAGSINVLLALVAGATVPGVGSLALAAGLGFVGYGLSLAAFVVALRELGTARTGAYFSTAPFIGALVAVLWFSEPLTLRLIAAGLLMGLGVWLHLTERHDHRHRHEAIEHDHRHTHDEHHRHHDGAEPDEPHAHPHRHRPLLHSHPHYPDAHHRHDH